ncbi:MAG: DUF502 domain-containing protein [bacterium]
MTKKTIFSASASAGRHFIAGLMILLPLVLSFWILRFLLSKLDSILGPLFTKYIGFSIPGLGLISLIVIIWFTGVLTTNFIGKEFVRLYESLISKVPILNTLFSGIKQISDSLFSTTKKSFSKVVLVDIPRSGILLIGFLTSDQVVALNNNKSKKEVYHVFIPTTPNPTSGFIILVEAKFIKPVDVSVEDGFKSVISLGVFHPSVYKVNSSMIKLKGVKS